MTRYRILWVDDQHADAEMVQFLLAAESQGLDLEGYASFEEAFDILERRIHAFDAILLDGMFFEKREQVAGSEDEAGLGMAIRRINELKSTKVFPWFVLSGKTEFTKGRNMLLYANKAESFDKTKPSDVTRLFEEIKSSCGDQFDTQIRHKYARIFDVCIDKYIGGEAAKDILNILKEESAMEALKNPEIYFTPLRKIVEDVFRALNKYKVLPDSLTIPTVALNESSRFLAGSLQRGFKLNFPVCPPIILNSLRSILQVCQPAAHRAEIDDFIKLVNSPYSLFATTYQLLDVLLWLKNFIDSLQFQEPDKAFYAKEEAAPGGQIGLVMKDEHNNYHCLNTLITYKHFNDMNYKVGDPIRIIQKRENSKEQTRRIYPETVSESELIKE